MPIEKIKENLKYKNVFTNCSADPSETKRKDVI